SDGRFLDPTRLNPERFTWRLESTPKTLSLFGERGGGATLLIEGRLRLFLERKERVEQPGWAHVTAVFENALLDGWIEKSIAFRNSSEVSIGTIGHGFGCSGGGMVSRPKRVRIPSGTMVYAEPNKYPWATVPTDMVFQVGNQTSDGWAWIADLPGLGAENP